MSYRHKAIKSSLDVGLVSEWNDDHILDYTDEIEEQLLRISESISESWDTSQTSGGSVPVWGKIGSNGSGHAFVILNTGAVTGKISSMRLKLGGSAGNVTSPDDLPIFTATINISAISTTGNVVEFGFFENSVSPFTANQKGAYFRIKNDQLYAVSGTGTAETEALIGSISTYNQYRIEFGSSNIKYYVNDMASYKVSIATNRPISDLTIKISVISANNVDSTIRTDGVSFVRLRKK